jgi:hypothetical protein
MHRLSFRNSAGSLHRSTPVHPLVADSLALSIVIYHLHHIPTLSRRTKLVLHTSGFVFLSDYHLR